MLSPSASSSSATASSPNPAFLLRLWSVTGSWNYRIGRPVEYSAWRTAWPNHATVK